MLTEAQRVAIRRHLGLNSASQANYPFMDVFWGVNTVLDTLPADTEAEVLAILGRLAALEGRLDNTTTGGRLKARAVGPIQLNPEELNQLWREVQRWRRELSTLLGIPMGQPAGIVVA